MIFSQRKNFGVMDALFAKRDMLRNRNIKLYRMVVDDVDFYKLIRKRIL